MASVTSEDSHGGGELPAGEEAGDTGTSSRCHSVHPTEWNAAD